MIPISVREWEEAGTSLASALANYLKLSTFLETSHVQTKNTSKELVARIDSSLRTLHKTLNQQLCQSRVVLSKTRNKLGSLIYRFPEEILSEIFLCVIYSPDEDHLRWPINMGEHVRSIYRRLYGLLSVCIAWRNIGLSRPVFWSIVPMVDSTYSCWHPLSAELSLQRSGLQNLDLVVNAYRCPAFYRMEEVEAFLEYVPRSQSLNVHSGYAYDINQILSTLLRQGVPEIMSQLSLCFQDERDVTLRPNSEQDCISHAVASFHSQFTQLMGSLSAFRVCNIPFDWKYVTFSTRLVELRVDRIVLPGNMAITAFMTALSSARELRDLKLIRIEAFADQGPVLPESPLLLPKLQTLYLEELYFNFLDLLASITPQSYLLTFTPCESATQNLLADSSTEEVALEDVHSLLARYSINKLILADDTPVWTTQRGLHSLLCSTPTLKTLILNFYELDNKIIKALEPPSGTHRPFPKLETIEFRSSTIPSSISALKAVVNKHPIRHLMLGQTSRVGSEAVAVKLKANDGIVRWLKANVPGFQFVQHDNSPPECTDIRWRLWDF